MGKATAVAAASFRPDEMSTGGLQDNFDGSVDRAIIAPWDYNGKREEYTLAVFLHIVPDEGEEEVTEPFWQPYSCGNINDFLPSKDGNEPVDFDNWGAIVVDASKLDEILEELEPVIGTFAVPIAKRTQLSASSNWAKFIGFAIEAGFDVDNITNEVTFIEGVHGHFQRMLPERKGGIIRNDEDEGKERKGDGKILALTDITPAPKSGAAKGAAKAKASPAATKKASPAASKKSDTETESAGDDEINSEIEAALIEAIAENDGTLPKSKVMGVMVKTFRGRPDDSKKALGLVKSDDVLGGFESINFNVDEGTLTLVE